MSDGPILDQINLVVSDMEATVAFSRRLGLKIPDTDPMFQSHHLIIDPRSSREELTSTSTASSSPVTGTRDGNPVLE